MSFGVVVKVFASLAALAGGVSFSVGLGALIKSAFFATTTAKIVSLICGYLVNLMENQGVFNGPAQREFILKMLQDDALGEFFSWKREDGLMEFLKRLTRVVQKGLNRSLFSMNYKKKQKITIEESDEDVDEYSWESRETPIKCVETQKSKKITFNESKDEETASIEESGFGIEIMDNLKIMISSENVEINIGYKENLSFREVAISKKNIKKKIVLKFRSICGLQMESRESIKRKNREMGILLKVDGLKVMTDDHEVQIHLGVDENSAQYFMVFNEKYLEKKVVLQW